MRLTSIDIGTNTILMLVADVTPDGTVSPVRDEQVIARLGKGVDAHRRITSETSDRVLRFLQDYKAISESLHSEKIIACGTSALRDASNTREFIRFVKEKLGLEITVLSGEQEAELTYRGAVSEFSSLGADQPLAVLDIGGGSTELTTGIGASVTGTVSLDLGCVRLTERVLLSSPPTTPALNHAISEVREAVLSLPLLSPQIRLIGVAGTVTTLAAIDLKLESYVRSRVSGHFLTIEAIELVFNRLKSHTLEQMAREFPQIESGRADIILAGIVILVESMRRFGVRGITVSDRGLRYGMAQREFSSGAANS
jgi:exopolyphosphatase/guanosine-5'-triphosphate,3'-diphosphate pyrophosphatase